MRDARRRNRNIGTPLAGRGKDNRNVIPDRWSDLSSYWENLQSPVVVRRDIEGNSISFIVEPPRAGSAHACTVDDICEVLRLLPKHHARYISLVVLRQPTRRQETLNPVWGRLGYWSEICGIEGPGIYLEARPAPTDETWPLSLTPDQQRELARLKNDGHAVEKKKRGYEIHSTYESIRNTQLFRTVAHEVGHYVDYLTFDAGNSIEHGSAEFWDLYGAKPGKDKEDFAHRYADEFQSLMKSTGNFPFRQLRDPSAITLAGLKPKWFAKIGTEL